MWNPVGVCARLKDNPAIDSDEVSFSDLKEWSSEFENMLNHIDRLFVHPSSRKHAEQYLRGLLAPIERKNGWTIVEHVGEKEPKAMQRFLNLALWDADELRDLLRDYVIEHLNDPQGILVADPTGFAKKGKKSAGVQRQYSGTLGRVDNCQIGTFLSSVTSNRDRVLLDRELYIPQDSWFGDPDRCAEAAIPDDLTFTTRPMQVMTMIERARESELTFAWFTADEEFGQNPRLRTYLEQAEISYVMAIPKNTEVTDHTRQKATIEHRATRLAPNDWQRRSCGIDTTGFRVYDWACSNPTTPTTST
jgi:SRSO17 transposase